MKDKIYSIVEGAIAIVFGILIAVFGGGEVVDIYFGIIALIAGVCLLAVAIVWLVRKQPLAFGTVFGAVAALTVGIFLLAGNFLSFAMLVNLLVVLFMALGIGLVLYGVYVIIKQNIFYGVGQAVVGALCITFSALYIAVPDFQKVFWIIVGVVVAVYGLFVLILALIGKKEKKA